MIARCLFLFVLSSSVVLYIVMWVHVFGRF
jgi:hypothetical protein